MGFPSSDTWEYPPTALAQERAGIFSFQHYLKKRRCYLERHARDLPLLLDCVALDVLDAPSMPRRRYWLDTVTLEDDSSSVASPSNDVVIWSHIECSISKFSS